MGLVTRRLLEKSSQQKGFTTQVGTHAMGGYAGTITFPAAFTGTPTISLQILEGSSSFGRNGRLRAPSVFSGSFTYAGSGGHGTFSWLAIGP